MASPTIRRPRRTTIDDVATRAGVSVATVSRALRGLPNVATSTRQRVTDVAEALHYRPDPAASRLAAGRTRTVMVAVPALNGWYFATVVAGAEAVCTEAEYDFSVVGIGSSEDRARLLHEDAHLERRTDGLVLVDLVVTETEAASLRARGLALATVGSSTKGHPSVAVDDVHVGRIATRHLIDNGHTRIGVIGGLQHNPMSFDVPRARQRGYEDALRATGLDIDDSLLAPGNFGIEGGQEAMSLLLDHHEPPTAVFAMSDEMAFGALMELRDRDLRPGHDVSLIGVDDHEFSQVVDLTTVRQRVASHGAIAARLLIDAMSADGDTTITACAHSAPVELIERGTVGPPGGK